MKAKRGNLIIIYINNEHGFDEITAPLIFEIIKSHKPDYYEFLLPDSFFIYYKAKKQKKIYDALLAKFQQLISRDDRFQDAKIGMASGEMIYQTDWLGRIRSAPVGGPGNDATKNIIISRKLS